MKNTTAVTKELIKFSVKRKKIPTRSVKSDYFKMKTFIILTNFLLTFSNQVLVNYREGENIQKYLQQK